MKGYTIQNSIDLLEKVVENGGGGGGGATSAENVSYDNTSSGLLATNVQGALDELDTSVDTLGTTTTEISGRFDYSTTEAYIGKFGTKDHYRRVVELPETLTVGYSSWTLTDIDFPGDAITSCRGFNPDGTIFYLMAGINNDKIQLLGCRSGANVTVKTIILEYIKTSAETRTKKKGGK